MINKEIKTKIIKIVISIVIGTIIIFSLGMVLLKYNVEGETNIPFEITKMQIISSSMGNENIESRK